MTMTADAPPAARLRVRRPKLDFRNSPKYWIYNDPQSTHSLNLLHFGIPAGERYFIDGVRLAMKYLDDAPHMLADARAFIGQESNHARLHERAAEHLHLFEMPMIQAVVDRMDARRVALYKRVDSLPEPLRRQAVLVWLSGVALGEHFTALFADFAFDEKKIDQNQVDPAMVQLIQWHAAEELEHRNVPFDIYTKLGGTYVMRIAVAAPAIALLPIGLIALTDVLLRVDPDVRSGFSVRNYVRAIRARRVPNILDVMGKMPVYLLPNHHPSKIANDEPARAYLAANPQLVGRN